MAGANTNLLGVGIFQSLTTAQRDAIKNPIAGMVVFNSTTGHLNVCTNGSGWEELAAAG